MAMVKAMAMMPRISMPMEMAMAMAIAMAIAMKEMEMREARAGTKYQEQCEDRQTPQMLKKLEADAEEYWHPSNAP
jgi:hypothetical protein